MHVSFETHASAFIILKNDNSKKAQQKRAQLFNVASL